MKGNVVSKETKKSIIKKGLLGTVGSAIGFIGILFAFTKSPILFVGVVMVIIVVYFLIDYFLTDGNLPFHPLDNPPPRKHRFCRGFFFYTIPLTPCDPSTAQTKAVFSICTHGIQRTV
jgi:hypothetical protein